nr:MAG TPA: hypothetical protein [Caudoviricetes sp.]
MLFWKVLLPAVRMLNCSYLCMCAKRHPCLHRLVDFKLFIWSSTNMDGW